MFYRKVAFAAFLAALPVGAVVATPVIVTGTTHYDANADALANTNGTFSFSYDDSTSPTTIGSYYGDGTTQQRTWTGFLTAPLTITNILGTQTLAAANSHLIINYAPYAGASNASTTSFNLFGYESQNPGASLDQVFLSAANNATFAATGLPTAGQFPALSADFGGFAYTTTSASATITSLTINPNATPAPAVPEPATWAMLVAGFGLIGGAMRQRRTQVRFA